MFRGTYVLGQHRLNVELPRLDEARDSYGLGIERIDGKDDPKFQVFHGAEMSLADLHKFTRVKGNAKWEQEDVAGARQELRTTNGEYKIVLTYPKTEYWTADGVKKHFVENYS